ncbi:class I SAM-dependent methyltransferase [Planktothrix sp. FACHB-1355]|uniref:Class I SAM-dependent methyltransferase n=1 Tax=Aerosakkonema funiforme FACHB-1375 TaxID=2949571 RepID=A0A926VF31_9CYAN|nr:MULTISPECIES: class I SAM-dependent methyltransferase [Oscillatoriales]MBD2182073.1 class I SAM-dependent methyltransferase [Aerosakkonema funiforme FACHB-1375]MBD3562155.1 class I SAM-dependent methyltransferase [Planktothrix sp. FACHB-1355]
MSNAVSNELENQIISNIDDLKSQPEAQSIIELSDTESIHYDGRHYDLIYDNFYPFSNLAKIDIPFWTDMVSQYGEPVLELCCGTGRIAFPLAEKGLQVTGIDISDSMLGEARKKSDRVEWIKADVCDFDLGKQFSLIIFSLNSIYHLLRIEDLESCFNCVKKHLKPDGKFIIDMLNYYTKPTIEAMWSPLPTLYSVYPDPDGRGTMVVTVVNELDVSAQIAKSKLFFRLIEQKKEFVEETKLRLYHPNEMGNLLKYNGFIIETQLGGYDKAAFTSGAPNYIAICKLGQ